MKAKLILLGGGGHCKSCIDVIESTGLYEIHGILDRAEFVGTKVLDYDIIGTDEDVLKYHEQGFHFFITVGQIKSAAVRKKLFCRLSDMGAEMATIVSATAVLSKYAQLGAGTILMHQAIVNAAAKVGANAIINTAANIEHDVVVGDHCHISTYAVVNGDCKIGNEVFIGSNATISSQVEVSDNTVVGAGAVVYKNIKQQGTYAGNPAKIIG
ncbi:MAG: acetyltransferase [Sphingobacteriales bacterium]|nr:MAG: acetyltransferase [Sphingobacteriales bacterium]